MSTAASLITRVQRQLLSGVVEERNKLSASMTATATTAVFTYELSGIRKGSIIEIESELMYVWDVAVATKTATVERGFNGTIATTHASGTVAVANPRFPRNQILEAINDDLADLAAPMNGLYRVKTLDTKYNGSDPMIGLPASGDIIDIVSVHVRIRSNEHRLVKNVSLVRNLPTSDFGSSYALKFNEDTIQGDMRIVYKAPFNRVTKEGDDIQTVCGYPLTAEDILVMGAQIRLMAPREIKRNFTESQGDTRRSDEVPAGAVANSISNLVRLRRDRITAEATKLDSQYPIILNRV